jgi:hypothetical protein
VWPITSRTQTRQYASKQRQEQRGWVRRAVTGSNIHRQPMATRPCFVWLARKLHEVGRRKVPIVFEWLYKRNPGRSSQIQCNSLRGCWPQVANREGRWFGPGKQASTPFLSPCYSPPLFVQCRLVLVDGRLLSGSQDVMEAMPRPPLHLSFMTPLS